MSTTEKQQLELHPFEPQRAQCFEFPPSVILQPPDHAATDVTHRCPASPNTTQLSASLSAEGAVSVPAVQPHCQDWLHPWGGHTGGPVRVLETLRGAVIGH